MTQKAQQESLTLRARLKVSRALNPALYDTLASLPQSDLSDFVLQVLKDWSRGRLTERPGMPDDPGFDGHTSTPRTSTVGEHASIASPPLRRQSRQVAHASGTMPATRQQNDTPSEKAPARQDSSIVANNDMPTRTLADLGINSTDDWNDAFNYSTPSA